MDDVNVQAEEAAAEGTEDDFISAFDDEAEETPDEAEEDEAGEETTPEPEKPEPEKEAPPEGEPSGPIAERQFVERLAQVAGMSPDDFMKNAEGMLEEQRQIVEEQNLNKRMQQLLEQGYDENLARHTAELENKVARLEKVEEGVNAQANEEAQRKELFERDVRRMYEACPETQSMEKMPPEVIAGFQTGLTPMEAYLRYELEKKNKDYEALELKLDNLGRTTGSPKGGGGDAEDEFAKALTQDYL